MIRRTLAGYSVEFANAIRLRATYIGPALVILTVLLLTFQYPIVRDSTSDFGFVAVAIPTAVDLVGVFVLLVYCSTLITVDIGSGLIRLVLVRPMRRREYFAAKLLMGWTYALVLMLLALVLSVSIALVSGELAGIYYGDTVIYTSAEMRNGLFVALGLNILPLFATVNFALFISAMNRSRTIALALALVVWIALDLLKQPLGIEAYFFSTYLEHSWDVFLDRCNALPTDWSATAPWAAAVSAAWIAGLSGASLLVLSNRDLTQ